MVDRLSLVDYGDVPTVPGSTGQLERSTAALAEIARAGRRLFAWAVLTVLLAELRALAPVHGPLALVQLDSHHDLWDEYFGQKLFHGSVVRRALEEGLIDPSRSIQAGLRGSLNEPRTPPCRRSWGSRRSPPRSSPRSGLGRLLGTSPRPGRGGSLLSFDIDFVDPRLRARDGTPEVGGPSSREALTYVRSLAGLDFRGFDCVEVSPPFDPPA